MSLSGRSCSRLFPHDVSAAVTAVNHPACSPPALWQAVNRYQKLHHASTLHAITNLPPSLSLPFVSLRLSSLAGVQCHVWARDGREQKGESSTWLCRFSAPSVASWMSKFLIFLSLASGSAHLSEHPNVSAPFPSCLVDCNSIIWCLLKPLYVEFFEWYFFPFKIDLKAQAAVCRQTKVISVRIIVVGRQDWWVLRPGHFTD